MIVKTIPLYFEKIWGGDSLTSKFQSLDRKLDNLSNLGEVWGISAHSSGDTIVIHEGNRIPLSQFWAINLSQKSHFPFQIRLVDAKEDLSIQVHPDDLIAKQENEGNGKNEAWYILDSEKDSSIIFGTKVNSIEELEHFALSDDWEKVVKKKPIQRGDLIFVPAGQLHALKHNIVAVEVAENSDTTYRLFDYNRFDEYGKKRNLHIESAKKSIKFFECIDYGQLSRVQYRSCEHTTLLNNDVFKIEKLVIDGKFTYPITTKIVGGIVLEGEFNVDGLAFTSGEFFLGYSEGDHISFDGQGQILIAKSTKGENL